MSAFQVYIKDDEVALINNLEASRDLIALLSECNVNTWIQRIVPDL